jgi:hypothetical protein
MKLEEFGALTDWYGVEAKSSLVIVICKFSQGNKQTWDNQSGSFAAQARTKTTRDSPAACSARKAAPALPQA